MSEAVGGQTDRETETMKRGRENLTPEQGEKKKQKGEKIERKGEEERGRPIEKSRTTERARSLSSPAAITWLKIYFKKSSNVIIDGSTRERREKVREAIVRGEMKVQWRHPTATYEQIFSALADGRIPIETQMLAKIPDVDHIKMKNINLDKPNLK